MASPRSRVQNTKSKQIFPDCSIPCNMVSRKNVMRWLSPCLVNKSTARWLDGCHANQEGGAAINSGRFQRNPWNYVQHTIKVHAKVAPHVNSSSPNVDGCTSSAKWLKPSASSSFAASSTRLFNFQLCKCSCLFNIFFPQPSVSFSLLVYFSHTHRLILDGLSSLSSTPALCPCVELSAGGIPLRHHRRGWLLSDLAPLSFVGNFHPDKKKNGTTHFCMDLLGDLSQAMRIRLGTDAPYIASDRKE